jgi:hypothetical protein
MDELEKTARAFDRLRDLVLDAMKGQRLTTDEAHDIRASLNRLADAVLLAESLPERRDCVH